MFKNKYSSFVVDLAKQFLFWTESLVTKGLVFTDKMLRYKVASSLDIYRTVAWARVLVVWERGKIKTQKTIYGCEVGVSLNRFVSILLGVTCFI